MTTSLFTQEYRSTDSPAWPTLNGTASSLIALLQAILVDGGTTASVTSITRSGTTATATIASNTSLITGAQYRFTIAGANESDYNGNIVATAVNSTTITYTVANSPSTPATGTITYKRTGAGWSMPYTGTNLAVFRPPSISGFPQFYVRLDETGAQAGGQREVAVRAYETMSDVNTGTNPFPTVAQLANGLCWRKSTTADSTARPWTIFASDIAFWFVPNSDNSLTSGRHLNGFGGFLSLTTGDAYNGFVAGQAAFNTASSTVANSGAASDNGINTFTTTAGLYMARAYSQTGGSVPTARCNPLRGQNAGVTGQTSGTILYPNGPNGALFAVPAYLFENSSANQFRGRLPGVYSHGHSSLPINEYDTATNINGAPGVTGVGVTISVNSAQGLNIFDRYGPWG